MTEHRIIEGDVLAGLRTLPDNCVQCTVTSPPYYALRNYGVDGQIGLEETPEQFIQKMVEVFREVRRVTRPDGVLWLNLGDSYAGSGRGPTGENGIQNAEQRQGFTNNEDPRGKRRNHTDAPAGYKAKDLMGIPWRVAFALQADGWYFRSAMPWIKRKCMPESTTDRPTSAIEYIFLMAKSARYFYDGEAIRCPAAPPTGWDRSREKGLNYNRDDGISNGAQSGKGLLSWRRGGKKKQDQTGNPTYTGFNERYHAKMARNGTSIVGHSGNLKADGTPMCDGITRNYRNSDPFFESWQGLYSEAENPLAFIINPQARPEPHFATFPDLLAATCIKAGTSEYGCCPKCGAPWQRVVEASGGTTGKSWHPHENDEQTGQIGGFPSEGYTRQFKGWRPGCECGETERAPCLVLDPFMGSGTVAVVARELNRSSVGCELNPEYVQIIRKRLQVGSQLDSGVVSYRFEKAESTASSPGDEQENNNREKVKEEI